MADELKGIEQEVAEIHVQLGILHDRLAQLVKQRDVLLKAIKQAPKSGGTVISVPAAKLNVSGKV